MNLRQKLQMVSASPSVKPEPLRASEALPSCLVRRAVYPLSDVSGLFSLSAKTLSLINQTPFDDYSARGLLFMDTETTGLSGGAGTVAFLIGVGFVDDDGFVVEQYLMRDYPEEEDALRRFAERLDKAETVVTFNGVTFDMPLLESRFTLNGMRSRWRSVRHIDLLKWARGVFKLRLTSCRLGTLEEKVLSIHRDNDLPGAEVPARFFLYLKTGELALMEDILTHNRQDIATLAILLTKMCRMYENPLAQPHDEDVFSLGRQMERRGVIVTARKCYQLATRGTLCLRAGSLLAASYRRQKEYREAEKTLLMLVNRGEGGETTMIELAKLYEHKLRDLDSAEKYTLMALNHLSEPSLFPREGVQETQNALQYRYARIKRKQRSKRSGEKWV
ncbi:MAG: ribonuclease H-like domain-containing protein [Eubacteriales bacterium]|nr:ribonuclease H-like domain-containing protein [Eubacteriales bacterium]MDD3883139.1 ribonuclease H-like domain-containing protein [Eubacteriales bacterium]MDD4512691.1 ribonuclease H-like domain-containing protein [Eubacteriales bacterium]